MADYSDKVSKVFDTKDHTPEVGGPDLENDKLFGILSYIGILVLVPIFAAKDSRFARFHANQGLVLFLAEIAASIASSILGWIPFIRVIGTILGSVVGLASLVFAIIGIVNVVNGKAKELPIIGGITLIK